MSAVWQAVLAAVRGMRTRLPDAALPVDYDLLAPGGVLCFDPSLGNTGWAFIDHRAGARAETADCGVLNTDSDYVSHERTFDRASQLLEDLRPLVDFWAPRADLIVCERPAVDGMRTESALTAALMIWQAVREAVGRPVQLVSKQHAARLFCGPGRSLPKSATTAAVRAWLPPVGGQRFNEHIADAKLVGLTALYDLAHPGGTR